MLCFAELIIALIKVRRSKLAFFMRPKVFIKYCIIVQEIENDLGALGGHYFMGFLSDLT